MSAADHSQLERYEEARDIEPGSTHLANMIRGRLYFIDRSSKGASTRAGS